MKKIALILAVALLLPLCVFAGDANQMKYVQVLSPVASTATTGTVVNVAAYKGNSTFAAQFSSTTLASTGTVTLAHSTAEDGTFTTVTNLAGTACVITQTGPATNDVQTVAIDLGRVHAYVRTEVEQTGVTNTISAALIAPMKSE